MQSASKELPVTVDNPYLRELDRERFASLAADERYVQRLLDRASGAEHLSISAIRTPPNGGSPEGMHSHEVDQLVYVLEGTMSFEVQGTEFTAGPNSLVVYKAGTPHRNWNAGDVPTVHLAINVPLPEEGKPRSRPWQG
jgi:mannose-6-phosphate isomerase-like protein (cupin superfamily)